MRYCREGNLSCIYCSNVSAKQPDQIYFHPHRESKAGATNLLRKIASFTRWAAVWIRHRRFFFKYILRISISLPILLESAPEPESTAYMSVLHKLFSNYRWLNWSWAGWWQPHAVPEGHLWCCSKEITIISKYYISHWWAGMSQIVGDGPKVILTILGPPYQ